MHIKSRQSSQGQPKHSPGSTPAALQGRQKEGRANMGPLLATTLPSPESTSEPCSLGHGSCVAWPGRRHHLKASPQSLCGSAALGPSHHWLPEKPVSPKRETGSCSPETAGSSSFALLSPLHGRSLPALQAPQTDSQGWKSSQRKALALGETATNGSGSRPGNTWPVFAVRRGLSSQGHPSA